MVNGPKPNANKPNANKLNGPKPNANKLTANKLKGEYLPRSDGLKRYTRSQSGEYLGGIEALGLLGYDAGSIIGRKVANASTSTVRGFSKLGSKLFKKSKISTDRSCSPALYALKNEPIFSLKPSCSSL